MAHILIVDDETGFTGGISEFLRHSGHSAVAANTLSAARHLLTEQFPDVVLLDLMLPDGSGLELLDAFAERRPARIVIVTGHSGVTSLIGNVAGDGVSYLQKPVEPKDIIGVINAAMAHGEAPDALPTDDADAFGQMVGESPAMAQVRTLLEQVAPTRSAVFVQGESGTGKELVAESLHALSGRSGKFVPVNCGGLSSELVSSQLFGHEKGSFTGATGRHSGFFQRAAGGTLFLDEITEMPIEMQTHLLRALETQRILPVGSETELDVDVRVVAATNRDPAAAVREGQLREDLYFRLSVFPVELPPLRERGDDVILLADHFLASLNRSSGTARTFSSRAYADLANETWPGNVRELKHAVQRAHILATEDVIERVQGHSLSLGRDVEGVQAGRSIADVEQELIMATLAANQNDKKAAAASLGISLKTLYNRLKTYEEQADDG